MSTEDGQLPTANSQRAQQPQYYQYPALKPPVWTWEIPAYFFVGGAAGAAALIGAVARRTGGDPSLVRDARWIAAAGAAVSPPLLISDLGRPERFLNMLRVFKLRSPMSVGAWTLVAFSNAAAASAFADLAARLSQRACPERAPRSPERACPERAHRSRESKGGRLTVKFVADAADVVSAATGLVLSTYTGVLLGATAIPVWSANARLLPLQFGASGLGSAASMLELLGHRERALNTIGIGTALVETAISAHIELSEDAAMRPIKNGRAGTLARAAGVLSGPLPLAIRLLAGRSQGARRVAALSTIAGSILTRAAWIAAGKSPSSKTG